MLLNVLAAYTDFWHIVTSLADNGEELGNSGAGGSGLLSAVGISCAEVIAMLSGIFNVRRCESPVGLLECREPGAIESCALLDPHFAHLCLMNWSPLSPLS